MRLKRHELWWIRRYRWQVTLRSDQLACRPDSMEHLLCIQDRLGEVYALSATARKPTEERTRCLETSGSLACYDVSGWLSVQGTGANASTGCCTVKYAGGDLLASAVAPCCGGAGLVRDWLQADSTALFGRARARLMV